MSMKAIFFIDRWQLTFLIPGCHQVISDTIHRMISTLKAEIQIQRLTFYTGLLRFPSYACTSLCFMKIPGLLSLTLCSLLPTQYALLLCLLLKTLKISPITTFSLKSSSPYSTIYQLLLDSVSAVFLKIYTLVLNIYVHEFHLFPLAE